MNSLIIFCAQYLPYIIVAIFLLLLIFSKKDRRSKIKFIIFAGFSVFIARVIFTEIIRYFYYIPRPFVNSDIVPLISHEATGSFPSGHAAFFFALAMSVYFHHKRWSILFFAGALLIGLARVIAGIHWPLDILAGAVIGVISSVLVAKFFKKL
ncbi:phosphatase PAP2 family protein [Patescibacteria group bacterium]|nr:phosphatase PAP2 family protein [Patescibacteria group bacterium]MBU2263040.1 phosphatase PAP2 family protein [Patescibacteria group bacterium]